MKTLHTIYNNFAKCNLASLRLWLVMFLTLTITTNAWSAEGDKHTFTNVAFNKLLNNSATISDVTISDPGYPVKTIIVNCKYNKTAGGVTISIKIGGKTFASSKTHNSSNTVDIEFTDEAMQGDVVFSFVNNCGSGTSKGTFYFNSVTLVEGAPAAPCTVKFYKTSTTFESDTEASAGDGVTPPSMESECGDWTFQGWSESYSNSENSTTKLNLVTLTNGKYYPTKDVNLYPVYTKTEDGGGSVEETLAQTLQYDTWSYSGSTTNKNSYRLFHSNSYVESAEFDLSTLSKVVVYGGTFGGNSYNKLTIAGVVGGTTTTWKSVTVSGSSQTGVNTYTGGTSLSGTGKLRVTSNSGSSSGSGVRISKIMIYTLQATSTTYYYSYPQCTTETAVTLNPNGGKIDGSNNTKEIQTENGTLTLPEPTRDCYTFTNWNTKENGTGTSFAAGEIADWDSEITTLYAQWEQITYTITWKNGDDILETDNNVPCGTTPTYNGATPTKTATAQYTYTFSDWSPTIYAADKDQIYTAQFNETTRQYTVTFNANGHGTAPDQQSVDYGTKATEPTEPTAFGYTFGGWYKEEECTNVWDFATDVVTGNITLYAQWTEKDLTNYRTACDVLCYGAYSFHTGDDDVKTNNTGTCFEQLDKTTEWQITNYTIPADKNYFVGYLGYYYDDNLGTNNARSAVKTWAEEMYIAPAMDSDDATNSPKLGQATGAVGTLRIFDNSNWNNLYVGFIPDGYKLKFGDEEYTFAMHNEGDREYRSEAVVEYNSTTADKNVSVGIVDADGKYVATNHSQEMRHVFLDVSKQLDGGSWSDADAKFAIYYWTNSTSAWCGFLKKVIEETHVYEGWIPADATGFKFVRYNSNQSAPGSWDNDKAWNQTGDLTFQQVQENGNLFTITNWGTGTWSTYEKYGQFAMHDNSKSKNWYVHFIPHNALKYDKNADEATGTMNVQTVVYDAEDKNVTVAECGFTRNGYRFIKWRKDNTNTYYNSGVTIDLDKDITLYAQWEKEYTVTYNANGGVTTCVDNNIYIKGDEVTVCTENPSKEGHTFLGWSDGTNTYSAGATFTMPANDVTLTAQWQINQYTVTLNPNYPAGKTGTFTDKEGNTVNGNLVLTYDYNTASMSLNDLYQSIELDGYKFNGWFSATVGGSPWTQTGEIKKNVTVYAQWTKLYGITLSENGTRKELEPQTSTSYTLPIELSVGSCDNDENELVGWSTVTIPTPGDRPTTNFYDLGETVTLTEDQTTFYAVFAKPNMDAKEISIAGGDMKQGAPDWWVTSGTGTYSNHGVKFDHAGDYILSPSLGDYSDLLIKLKAGHNDGSGSVLTFYAYKKDNSLFGNDEVTITPTTLTPTDSYTNQKTVYEISIVADEPIQQIMIMMTSKTKNLGMEYCEIFALPQKYFDYTTTCLSKHSITYDFNGGEGNCEEEKVTHGEDYTICDEEPTNAGYTFLYWANGEDTYAPGATIENVQADITLTAIWQEREKYTLTFNDQGDTKEFQYIESLPVEMQEPWADICSGPIQYVFDGWAAKAPVNNGTTEYEKVDFSTFTMPAENTTLYAVYRYAEDGGEPVNGFVKVTETLTDWSGDYVIVDDENLFAIKNAYRENTSSNKTLAGETVTIENDKVVSPSANIVWTFSKNGETGYTMYSNANNMYAGVTEDDTRKAILSSEVTDDCIFEIIFNETTKIVKVSATKKGRCFQYYENEAEWRTYSSSSHNTGNLYRLSEKTILYTSSLICGSITAEDALVTSTKDQKVKVKVPITLESSTGATTINATSDNAAFDVTGLTDVEAGDHTIVVEYTPAEYNIIETANITLSATNGATTTFTVSGRSLPETFAIVAKVGDVWYALPSQGLNSTTPPAAYPVEVDDIVDPTAVVSVPANADWSLRQVYANSGSNDRFADNGEKLVFVNDANPQKALNAGSTGNYLLTDTQYDGYHNTTNPGLYEWTPTTTDRETYQLTNEQRSRTLSVNTATVFGVHATDKAVEQVRFLPIQNRYTPAALQVVEWKENSVVIMYNGDPVQTASVSVNGGAAQETSLSSTQRDIAVYELAATGLAANPAQRLSITIGTEKVILSIPYIISGSKNDIDVLPGSTVAARQEVAKVSDLVILKGATLTAAGAKGNPYKFRNVTIYGGGSLIIPTEKGFGVNSLTLRAGGVTADDNYDYVYPQFVLNGTWTNTSGKINLDYLTTKEQYYTFVAPFAVQTKDIHYPVDIYGSNVKADNKGSFEFEYYDGEARATGATGWKTVEEGADGATLEPGQGYTFLGMPKKVSVNGGSSTRQKFGIHRIPMTVRAEDAMTHENSDQSAPLSVHLADKNNDSGWNLIGNPYMATISGLTNEDIQVGKLVHTTDANGNWTGGWHWDEQNVREGQRFLVIPSNDGQSFESTQASNANLPAFKNFFVQISNKDANALVIPYNKPTNVLAAPARRTEEVDQDIELAIVLEQDEAHSDQLDFLINNIYTEDFERDADFTKMMNATNLNLYGVHPYDNLSFVAIDNNTARGSVAIGYQVPQAGEYTLRMSDKPYIMWDKFEALYVTDHEMSPEVTTDIMSEPYRFTVANAETNHTRFTVSVILKVEEDDGGGDVGTGVDNTTNNNTPCKFIYQDKMYILRNGVIYDAMGKQVQTINK